MDYYNALSGLRLKLVHHDVFEGCFRLEENSKLLNKIEAN